tara:strand:+ start:913 stop:1086 length:174 start_codon:yes stop_codon:yes gene_type:complete
MEWKLITENLNRTKDEQILIGRYDEKNEWEIRLVKRWAKIVPNYTYYMKIKKQGQEK